jgi:hypothetical protein
MYAQQQLSQYLNVISKNRERNGNHTTFSAGLKDSSAWQIRLKKSM